MMNVEKTIEFILDNQAKAEGRSAKADRRMDRLEGLVEKLARSGEFILDNQAKAEERFNKSERRLERIERILAQTNRVVAGLARSGLSLRSDVRELQKFRTRSEKFQARTDENLAEITDKLNALIDLVDKSLRRNGGGR